MRSTFSFNKSTKIWILETTNNLDNFPKFWGALNFSHLLLWQYNLQTLAIFLSCSNWMLFTCADCYRVCLFHLGSCFCFFLVFSFVLCKFSHRIKLLMEFVYIRLTVKAVIYFRPYRFFFFRWVDPLINQFNLEYFI